MGHGVVRFIVAGVVLGLGVASAQEQTASIVGVVRDASGGVLPGASVRVAYEDGLAVNAWTDDSGRYRFPALPPGTLGVTAEFPGFAPAHIESVELHLGRRLDVPITLGSAALSETIRVSAESTTIAITQSSRAVSIRQEEFERLPNGRDFTDVVGHIAGANPEPQKVGERDDALGFISVDGSSGAENRFIVDGAESTDLVWGFNGRTVVPDFVDEIQVKSSGYTPEYGGSTGGVINAVTRSGSNAWHGDALLYWEADGLDAGNRPTLQLNPEDSTVAEYVTFPKDDYHGLEPGFTLGGPILRDRLWLFAGYIPRFHPIRRTAPFVDGTTDTLRTDRRSHNAVVSVTGQAGSSWRFRASYNMGRVERHGLLHNQNGTSSPEAAYDTAEIRPGWSLSGSVDWIPSPTFYTSVRAAYSFSDRYTENVYEGDRLIWQTSSIGLPGVPPEYQQPVGFQNTLDNQATDRAKMGRLGIQWDSTFFFEAAGRHQLKAGVQLDRRSFDILIGDTGNRHQLFWDQSFVGQRGPFGYYNVWSNPAFSNRGFIIIGDSRITNLGLFVQDAWTINDRLTLNLGLRTENEKVPSFTRNPNGSETAIEWGLGDKLAPRLGFAWDATGDGRTKVYGSWGIFYDIMKLRMSVGLGSQFLTVYRYTLDSPDLSQIQDNPLCPPECPGRLIWESDVFTGALGDPDDSSLRVDPGIDPMRLQEAVLGVERQITSYLTLSARYIHKQLDRAVSPMAFGEGSDSYTLIGNPGFGMATSFVPQGGTTAQPFPRTRRDYDAVEIGLRRRMAHSWAGRLFYTWSRLRGNHSGLANADWGQVAPNFDGSLFSPMTLYDETGEPSYGPLGTDRTHQIKAQLVYDFDLGTTVGASWFGSSGFPMTRIADFIAPGRPRASVFYQRRGTDGRMPFTSRLDLQLQHRFRLSQRTQLTLTATVFNLFNEGQPTTVVPWELFAGQRIAVSEAEFYEGVDTQSLIEEQGVVREPLFLMADNFQPPRTIRLAVRFSF